MLVGALLLAWGLASVVVSNGALRPVYFCAAGATAAFGAALYRRDRLSAWQVLGLGLAVRACVFWLPPALSDDVYRYLWDGLVQVRGLNPYAFQPATVAAQVGAPGLLGQLNSPDYYTVYPPVSQALFWMAARIGQAWGQAAAYGALKAAGLGADLGVLVLLLRARPPRRALLWAVAPYVVMEATGQVHTEVWCALALVAACRWERTHPGRSGLLMAAAAWIKLVPGLMVVPHLIRRRFGWIGVGFGAGLIVFALPYAAPYVVPHVRSSLDLYVRLFEFNAGPYYALKATGLWLTGLDLSKHLGPALRLGFLAALPLIWSRATRHAWPLARVGVAVYGLYLAAATTVHPWYFLPLLALGLVAGRTPWHWHALALASIGTYGVYTGGAYWPFVWLGWGMWAMLGAHAGLSGTLAALMRGRARSKCDRLRPELPSGGGLRVLDLGAGEGYVGERLSLEGAHVTLADVEPAARAALPALTAPGVLPFGPGAFDVVVLSYVLHHATSAEAVVREALRVGARVVILESVYRGAHERRVLTLLDHLANRVRGGWMQDQPPLAFRTVPEWEQLLGSLGRVTSCRAFGRAPHRQAAFVIGPLL